MITETDLRNRVIDKAISWLGCSEEDNSHKEIIDTYNAYHPLARSYKVKYTDAWCAVYVSAVFISTGFTNIAPTECGCVEMRDRYKNPKYPGTWVEDDSFVPTPGDLVMYNWDDSGIGDCTKPPQHVGLVTEIRGDYIVVIEGNHNKAVGFRTIAINGQYIVGFCIPDYAKIADEDSPKTERYYISEHLSYSDNYDDAVEVAKNFHQNVFDEDGNMIYKFETAEYFIVSGTTCLRLRKEPTTESETIAFMNNGTEVKYEGEQVDKWYKITLSNGKTGWASGKYLSRF